MNFRYTILYVDDILQTIEFYERAFGLQRSMIHESGDYGELATGSTKLAFCSKNLMRELDKNPGDANPKSPTFEVAFETQDVAASLETALSGGAQLVQDATEMPWGQTISYVRDINGFLIEICSPIDSQSD